MACILSQEEKQSCRDFFVTDEYTQARWLISGVIGSMVFSFCVGYNILALTKIDGNGISFVPILIILAGFTVWMVQICIFCHSAITYGPETRQEHQIYKLGPFKKSWTEVGALAVTMILRYAGFFWRVAWISFVADLQILWKLAYDPYDFWIGDVLVGVVIRVIVACSDKDLHDVVMISMLCLLIIYHRHWFTPSTTRNSEDLHGTKEAVTKFDKENSVEDKEF